MRSKVKIVSSAALFTALIMVATAYVKMPIAVGYVHAGDVFIVLGAFMLPVPVAAGVAALGSMLADLLSGYVMYMPVTFVAKGLMSLIFSLFFYKKFNLLRVVVGAAIGSVVMVAAYFAFESFYYGLPVATANLPAQFIQPANAVPVGSLISYALSKIGYINNLKTEIALKKPKKNSRDANENAQNSTQREP